ncbi:MAG: tetratricopeptide repeat protein, partial [Planctomycetales bacterium]|nr:tetratricopeptide repeat protein [Planctomycetales bacterium]
MLEDAVLFLQGFIGFEDRPNLVREQALAYQYLGKVQALLGEQTDAIASLKLAIDRQETIVELSPREFDSIQNLGLSWHELGRNQIFSNPIEAEKALLRSVELIKSLEGKLNGFELSLAETCNQLGTLYSNTSRPEQAAEMYRKSIQIRETFLKSASEPQDKDFFRRQLAQAHHNLGSLLLVRSNLSAAETEIRKADDLLSAEPEDSVMRRSFRNSRFEVCNSLATLLFDKGQLNDAVTQYERALAIAKERASLYPNIAEYKDSIARSHHNLANVYMTMQRKSDTLKEFQAATDIRRPLAQSHSDDAYQQTVFAETCAGLAHALSWNGKLDEANSSFREAMDALEGLVNKHPNMTRYIASLNSTEINYGLMLASIGDVTESLAAHQRVIDRAKAALQKDSGNSTMRLTLFNAHGARANTLISQQRFKEAIVNCDGVVDSASENEREFCIAWRLPTLARVDDHRAFQDVIQLAESGEKSAEVYYNLSCACAIAIQTMKNRTLDDTAKSDLESKYRTKAFEMLENTISQGFFTNPDSKEFLDNDSDFDELRKDARWQEFEQRISHAIENSNPAPRP